MVDASEAGFDPPPLTLLDDHDQPIAPTPNGPHRFDLRWAWALVAVAAVVLAAVGVSRRHTADRTAAPPAPAVSKPAQAVLARWPHATGVCGRSTELPIVAADPLLSAVSARVLVGGAQPAAVDLADGSNELVPGLDVEDGQFLIGLIRTGSTGGFALLQSCGLVGATTVARFAAGSRQRLVADSGGVTKLFGDADGVWGLASESTGDAVVRTLRRLDQPGELTLPPRFTPVAVHGSVLVGVTRTGTDTGGPANSRLTTGLGSALTVLDLGTGRVRRTFGPAQSVTVSQGLVLWMPQVCSAAAPCAVHSYDLTTGATTSRGYSLPVEAALTGGVLSPDRTRLAFELQREVTDPHYESSDPGTPSDVVVLDLRTGVAEGVPNLELAPAGPAGLVFSADSRWLVLAVDQGDSTQLLVWRSGDAKPRYSAQALSGPFNDPPLLVLDPRPVAP